MNLPVSLASVYSSQKLSSDKQTTRWQNWQMVKEDHPDAVKLLAKLDLDGNVTLQEIAEVWRINQKNIVFDDAMHETNETALKLLQRLAAACEVLLEYLGVTVLIPEDSIPYVNKENVMTARHHLTYIK